MCGSPLYSGAVSHPPRRTGQAEAEHRAWKALQDGMTPWTSCREADQLFLKGEGIYRERKQPGVLE